MTEAYYRLVSDILNDYTRKTPAIVTRLRPNQIFVFGTDKRGSQKYGAAGNASKLFGAKAGVREGPTGFCYALPSMGVSEESLAEAVSRFEQYVRANNQYTFLVTAVGCGHAGMDCARVSKMFRGMLGLKNVMLPERFLLEYRKECNTFFTKEAKREAFKVDEMDSVSHSQGDFNEISLYYNNSVHQVVRFLLDHDISFNKEGGFWITDDDGVVIAEAELGIESEKVVFSPIDTKSESVFLQRGYSIMTEESYLQSKLK